MTIYDVCRKIDEYIKPYRYRYEHDTKSKMYYFTLFKPNLSKIYFTLSEKTIRDNQTIVNNHIKNVKERYIKM